jgi:hypothetical protein
MVRSNLIGKLAASGDVCPWFAALGPTHELDAVGVIVAQLLLPMALEDTALENERLSSAQHQSLTTNEDGTGPLIREVRGVVELLRLGLRTQGARFQLCEALDELQNTCLRVIRLAPVEGEAAKVRSSLDSLMSACLAMQAQLDALEATERINAIWFSPRRLAVCVILSMGLWSLLNGVYVLAVLGIAALGVAWRYKLLMSAKSALDGQVKSLVRLCERIIGDKNTAARQMR